MTKTEIEKALETAHEEIAKKEIGKLRQQIADRPKNSVVIAEAIRKTQQVHYWETVDDDGLDFLSQRLAPLMKFREGEEHGSMPVNLDLKDVVNYKEMVEFGSTEALAA